MLTNKLEKLHYVYAHISCCTFCTGHDSAMQLHACSCYVYLRDVHVFA